MKRNENENRIDLLGSQLIELQWAESKYTYIQTNVVIPELP